MKYTRKTLSAKSFFYGLYTLIFVTLSLPSNSEAFETVCGAIPDGAVWDNEHSPYLATCDLKVRTLAIQPGVQVLFQENVKMVVVAGLKIQGAPSRPIQLSALNPEKKWGGLFVRTNSGASIELDYVDMFHSKVGISVE